MAACCTWYFVVFCSTWHSVVGKNTLTPECGVLTVFFCVPTVIQYTNRYFCDQWQEIQSLVCCSLRSFQCMSCTSRGHRFQAIPVSDSFFSHLILQFPVNSHLLFVFERRRLDFWAGLMLRLDRILEIDVSFSVRLPSISASSVSVKLGAFSIQ